MTDYGITGYGAYATNNSMFAVQLFSSLNDYQLQSMQCLS